MRRWITILAAAFIAGFGALAAIAVAQDAASVSNLQELERRIEEAKRQQAQQEAARAEAARKAAARAEAERRARAEAERQAAAAREEAARQEADRTRPGRVFRDALRGGGEGPEMVVIPAGSFRMGNLADNGDSDEQPHTVTIAEPFALGKYEVKFEEYDAFMEASGRAKPSDAGWGRGTRPVINVSWEDAQAYAQWLSQETGKRYRLPTEAEWEYAARAGTTTAYPWGNTASHEYANYGAEECCNGLASGRDKWVNTAPVGSFGANAFGLHDMHGNVAEWTEDCWHGSYGGAPGDGSAWTTGGDCGTRMYRGGSWGSYPAWVRSAYRSGYSSWARQRNLGFRLAEDLP